MSLIRRAAHVVRHSVILRGYRYLISPYLIDHVSVAADNVGCGCEQVYAFVLHHGCRHVVGYDRDVESHVAADRRCQARALEVWSGLRTEDPDVLFLFLRFSQHHADYSLGKALSHDGALFREELCQVSACLAYALIPAVVLVDREFPDGFGSILDAEPQRVLCRVQALLGDLLHAPCGGRSRMRDGVGGLGQIIDLLRLAPSGALVRGKRHAHGRGNIRSRALGHHVSDRRSHLAVVVAHDLLHVDRVDAAVQYVDFAVFIPGDVLILQHPRQVQILSQHFKPPALRLWPLPPLLCASLPPLPRGRGMPPCPPGS